MTRWTSFARGPVSGALRPPSPRWMPASTSTWRSAGHRGRGRRDQPVPPGVIAGPVGRRRGRTRHGNAHQCDRRSGTRRSDTPAGRPVHRIRACGLGGRLPRQAYRRGIDVIPDSPLQRILFEEGDAVGAVLGTASGLRAVRARRGVLVSTGGHDAGAVLPCDFPECVTLQVSVLRKAPSRFGRVELLTGGPPVGARHTTCRPMLRHLRDNARETRQRRSPNWRCGELHGYPPLGK